MFVLLFNTAGFLHGGVLFFNGVGGCSATRGFSGLRMHKHNGAFLRRFMTLT